MSDDDASILPGTAHPHPPMAAEDLADRLDVSTADVLSWVKEGLPVDSGLIDPFLAANWLCWGRLDRCPLLQRRWQTYLRWFMPHVHAQDTLHRYRVRQIHRVFLPEPMASLNWYVPRIPVTADQVDVRYLSALSATDGPTDVGSAGPFARFAWTDPGPNPRVVGSAEVAVAPHAVDLFPDHRELVAMVEELACEFRYEYRHHESGEARDRILPITSSNEIVGSCLDCALELGRRLGERGRAWKLCSGVIANSVIANPHFWLKVDTTVGWVPVDPSLPAIARMLGADWRAVVAAYVGGCDARRITLAEGDHHLPSLPGGPSIGSTIGEIFALDGAGNRRNAWPCLDWVCGDCSWIFE
ncbi:MAG: hypothetical protein H0V44_07180 [Planctomycetes bacterium]|nr:hypothetical protein [Planctomycetota bacterium]